jgi:hypothetical protein
MFDRLQHHLSIRAALVLAAGLSLSACVTYLTPGAGASLSGLEPDAIAAAHKAEPQAPFPARIAIVRLQAPGYRSFGAEGVPAGNYSVVMTHEVETNDDFAAIDQWPQVLGVEPLSQLLLPVSMRGFDDLRAAALSDNADFVFAYSFDTRFHVENRSYQPEELITLGVLPGREAAVTSTAAGVFIDARSGYLYGTAEGSGVAHTLMTKWTKPSAADDTRLKAERSAYAALMQDARREWAAIAAKYANSANVQTTGSEGDAPAIDHSVSGLAPAETVVAH